MVDIFSETRGSSAPKWASFKEAGDSYQGTYVGKIVGAKDSFGNEQIIYQLLQEDGSVINVAMSLGKKAINQDMEHVKFGQIVGFKYKGMVTFFDKRTKKDAQAKDFALHQDPSIVDAKWLEENKNHMPTVTRVSTAAADAANAEADKEFAGMASNEEDIPFSSAGNLTNEDKLKVIEKLATDKLGADATTMKAKVMEKTGLAFVSINYDKIIEALTTL